MIMRIPPRPRVGKAPPMPDRNHRSGSASRDGCSERHRSAPPVGGRRGQRKGIAPPAGRIGSSSACRAGRELARSREKARYLLKLLGNTLAAEDPRRQKLLREAKAVLQITAHDCSSHERK